MRTEFRLTFVLGLALAVAVPYAVSARPPQVGDSAEPPISDTGVALPAIVDPPKAAVATAQLSGRLATFVENKGQWDSHARFRLVTGGKTIWMADSRIVFDVVHDRKAADSPLPANGKEPATSVHQKNAGAVIATNELERLAFSEEWIDASAPSSVEPIDPQPGTYNYFVGNDKARWHTSIHGYGGVIYHDVWKGVDVRLISKGADVEQEFLVRPGADTSKIQMAYRGIQSLEIADDGSLLVHTAFGDLRETNPRIYQEIDGTRVQVAGHFRLKGKAAFEFDVEDYNPTYALVIDPTLLYSTYLGGNGGGSCNFGCGVTDQGASIAVDQSGSAYVTGLSGSTNWPTTVGAYQTTSTTGVFVTKLSPLGDKLVYSTAISGNVADRGYGIAVNNSGEAYITGFASTGYPTTANAYQTTCSGSAFLTKLSAAGNSLIYSTCLGSNSTAQGIALDTSGRAYIAGFSSGGHPTTPGAFQPTISASASRSGFLSVLDTSASGAASLAYSTYLGGSVGDAANAVAVDSFGMAYLAGVAASADFPVTAGAYQTTLNNATSGGYDVFVAKLNPNAAGPASLIYATFVGGTGYSDAQGIAVDALGNAYFTGWAQSGTFPITGGPFPSLLNDSGVIAKLNAAGNQLVYSSFVASSGAIGTAIAADSAGNTYFTGYLDCRNSSIQTTPDAFQSNCAGGIGTNAYVMKVGPTGTLIYSSYLGGISPANGFGDQGLGIAIDATGDAYITGFTISPVFPTTPFAFQPALNPGFIGSQQFPADAFVTKFPLGSSQTLSVSGITPSTGGNAGTVSPEIVGTGFRAGTTVQLKCAGLTIVGTNSTVGVGGRFLNTTFDLTLALPAACDVVVTNSAGGSATLPQAFVIQRGGSPNVRFYLTGVEARKVPVEVAVGPADAIVFATVSNIGNVDSSAFLVTEPAAPSFSLTSVNPSGVASLATLTADSQVVWSAPIAAGSSQVFALTAATSSSSPNTIVASAVTTPDQVAYALCLDEHSNLLAAFCPLLRSLPIDCHNAYIECATGAQGEICGNLIRICQNDMAACNAEEALKTEALCGLQTVSPVAQVGPADPNGIVGPSGVGTQRWTPGPQRLTYAISFNNEPTATAPAQQVIVSEPLGPNVDVSSVTLPIITLPNAGTEVQIPVPSSSFNPAVNVNEFKTNADLRPSQNLLVAIDTLLNPITQTLTWTFTSIDPTTGIPPLNPLVGFLPPGAGASVSFSTIPKSGLTTGDRVVEQGMIVFDGQAPMSTLAWMNTIDNTPPISHVTALPSTETSANFPVAWSGSDVGAGIQDYTIHVSDSGGPFTAFQTNATSTSAIFAGQVGHTYGFYSVARDLVGNVETKTATAEATTSVSQAISVPNVVGLTQSAASSAITTAGLVVGTVTMQSSSTVPAGIVVSQSPASGASVTSGSAVNLVVSSGPAPVTVPNVVGLPQAAASSAITTAGLVVGTVTTQNSSTVAAGIVISQNPTAGISVAAASAVNLVVSTGPAPVSVPNVVGLTQSAASSAITTAGLVVGTVTTQSSSTVAAGNVISQSPAAGTSVASRSAVNLVISSGAADGLIGDVNGDGIVNCADLQIVVKALGSRKGQPRYNARADVNSDGLVNLDDLRIVRQHLAPGVHCLVDE